MTTATATREILTKEQIASEQETIRHNLARFVNKITNNGETIAQKYQDFVNGEYPDAKPYLIFAANNQLALMGDHVPDAPSPAVRVHPEPDADAVAEDTPKPKKPKITMKELANWDMGRLIRSQSDNGRKLILALYDMMNPPSVFKSANPDEWKYQKATQIEPHHEFRAMQELSKRGHGCQNPYAHPQTSAMEERRLQEWLARETREIDNNGLDIVTYLFHVIDNQKETAQGEIITKPYTQSQRLWSIKHLLWRGIDIPWEHITPADIEKYYRELGEQKRIEAERRLEAERRVAGPNPVAPLTPEQESTVLGMLEHMQRQSEEADAKAAAKAKKAAKKAAKRAAAAKTDAHDYNAAAKSNRNSAGDPSANGSNGSAAASGNNNADKDNRKDTGDAPANASAGSNGSAAAIDTGGTAANATADKDNDNNAGDTSASADKDAAIDTDNTDVDPAALTPDARGARAVANVIARHPEVDLDTALENHYSTAGVPKENLTHEQIYDAITAEANFQKRQAIIQNRMRAHDPNAAPEDNDPPKSRSP